MQKVKKTAVTLLLSAMVIALFSNTLKAATETTASVEDGVYSYSVTLYESEASDYLDSLEDTIEYEDKEYENATTSKIAEQVDTKTVTEKKKDTTLLSSKSESAAKKLFDEKIEYNEDGYSGTLTISEIQFETVSQGYYEQIENLDVDFSDYSQNELAKIDKEITKNGYTWTLIDVDWSVDTYKEIDGTKVPVSYKGTAHYQRVATYANPNKYRATAIYSGEVEYEDKQVTYLVSYTEVEPEVESVAPVVEEIEDEPETTNIATPVIIGLVGVLIIVLALLSRKNCYIYNKTNNNLKKIGSLKLKENNIVINLSSFNNVSNIYVIKFKPSLFNKIKNKSGKVTYDNRTKNINIISDEITITF